MEDKNSINFDFLPLDKVVYQGIGKTISDDNFICFCSYNLLGHYESTLQLISKEEFLKRYKKRTKDYSDPYIYVYAIFKNKKKFSIVVDNDNIDIIQAEGKILVKHKAYQIYSSKKDILSKCTNQAVLDKINFNKKEEKEPFISTSIERNSTIKLTLDAILDHHFLDEIGDKRSITDILKDRPNFMCFGYFYDLDKHMSIITVEELKILKIDFNRLREFHLFAISNEHHSLVQSENILSTPLLNIDKGIDTIKLEYDKGKILLVVKDIIDKSKEKEKKIKEGQAYAEMISDMKSEKAVDKSIPRYYITRLGKQSKYDQKIASFPYYGLAKNKSSYELYDRVEVNPEHETKCVIIKEDLENLNFNINTHTIINHKDKGFLEVVLLENNKGNINVPELIKEARRIKQRYETDIHESYRRLESVKNPSTSIELLKMLSKNHKDITLGKVSEAGLQWEIRNLLGEIFNAGSNTITKTKANKVINLIMELTDMDKIEKMDYSDRLTLIGRTK